AGVRIGTVRRIGLVDGTGEVALTIHPDIVIPADSVASIGVASLLGQNYVAVDYGASPQRLKDGDQIEVIETADFNDIMRQIGDLGSRFGAVADSFSGFGGDDMDSHF